MASSASHFGRPYIEAPNLGAAAMAQNGPADIAASTRLGLASRPVTLPPWQGVAPAAVDGLPGMERR